MTLLELLYLLRKHLKLVIALPLACMLAVGAYSYVAMPNTYSATVSMYVLVKQENTNSNSLSSDLSASQMVTNDVATLLKSDRVVNETASALGLDSLKAYKTSITSSTTSRVLSLEVTGPDAEMAANVANKMADEVSSVAHDVMNVDSVNVVDSAKVPTAPSGPKRPLFMAIGLLGGLFVAVAIVVVSDMLNTKVRDQEELEELLGVPVIGRIPAMKGGR
uniref:YveK family protein n=1 Tax=Parolsenella massiliensis TaxID=1871022 RepID=UPI0009348245|nr:Wzz/FepE/Etk N-terminal domain-containing protein [Parolsenella massiliensis]